MFINTYYDTKRSTIHLWEQIDGENKYSKKKWVPYVFVKSDRGNFKSIYGDTVAIKQFKSYFEYNDFNKNNHNIFENKVKPEIQYLTETYHPIQDRDIVSPDLKIYNIDIEVNYSDRFPKPELANDPVCLISIQDSQTDKVVTFGEKEYTGNSDIIYVHCPNEKELLRKFFFFLNKYPPHVISGWFIWSFDLPYLINRDKKINNGNYYNAMSPINVVRTWRSKKDNDMNIDIAGVTILDYMDVYKWYSPHNLERYSLDYVSNFELKERKLEYEGDLRELYLNDWNTYVEYNVKDSKLIYKLERKLGYIKLIQTLSLLTRVSMRYYDKMTALIEGAMLTYFRRSGLCAPTILGGHQKTFEAAYVKEPYKGMYDWLFSIDIQSSYPSHIITLNMSIETLFGRIMGLTEDEIIEYSKNRNFPKMKIIRPDQLIFLDNKTISKFNDSLKRGLLSIAPCGTIFMNMKPGVIAIVERQFFEKRVKIKKLMRQSEGNEKERYKAIQLALKILLNAVYGATSVPYSRYYCQDMAEAITACGRYTVKSGERFSNDIMNNPNEGLMDLLEDIKKND